jgi:hypothetical protein
MTSNDPIIALWVPEVDQVYRDFLMHIQYGRPDYKGPLGAMDLIKIVGQRYCEATPPTKLSGPITMVAEPDNRFDPLAISVQYCSHHIGHIAKVETCKIHSRWRQFDQTGVDPTRPKLVCGTDATAVYLVDI